MQESSTKSRARRYPYLAGALFRRELRLSLETRRLAQGLRFVGRFPGEVLVGTPEVAIRRGLAIDRTTQVEALDNALGGQFEVGTHQRLQCCRVNFSVSKSFHQH